MFNKKVKFSIATVSILSVVILFSSNELGATTQQDASLKKKHQLEQQDAQSK